MDVFTVCMSIICCNRISLNAVINVVAALQPEFYSKHMINQCLNEAYLSRAPALSCCMDMKIPAASLEMATVLMACLLRFCSPKGHISEMKSPF